MARRILKSATDQRPFVIIYHDFLESEILDNHYQRLIFIYLKKFADSKNQCYPSINTLSKLTGIGRTKVKQTLAELEQKGVLISQSRSRTDGGKTSNLYTLYDYKGLWDVVSSSQEELAAGSVAEEEAKMIRELEARGYRVLKEKEPESEPTKAQTQALNKKQFDIVNNSPYYSRSQDQDARTERYTLEEMKLLYDYDIMIADNPAYKQDIDIIIDILYDTLNTTKPTIRINGEDKPSMVVIGKLMKLAYPEIMYAINKYQEQTDHIKNPKAYMLTLLYNAREQMHLDISNQVSHDMANWKQG